MALDAQGLPHAASPHPLGRDIGSQAETALGRLFVPHLDQHSRLHQARYPVVLLE